MGISDKIWDGIVTCIKMNDKVIGVAESLKKQQAALEDHNNRLIRLETALELGMRHGESKRLS